MPQHARRLKVRRKDLRKPDEFETLTGQVVAWADENRSIVIAIVGALVLVGLGTLVVTRWRAGRNEAAAAAFQTAQTRFAAGNFAQAAQGFSDVATTYPSAPFGRLAILFRAHALARQGDNAGAGTAYEEYLATSPPADYLRQEALAGLGRVREATADTTRALEAYNQAADIKGPYRTDALLGTARIHEATGQPDKAQEIYKSVLKDTSNPEMRAILAAKLPAGSVPPAEGEGVAGASTNLPGAKVELEGE